MNRRVIPVFIAACTLITGTAFLAPSQAAQPAARGLIDTSVAISSQSTLAEKSTKKLNAALRAGWGGLPGGSVATVWIPGKGRWVGTVGNANDATGRGMDPSMQIPIGSATKPFTGTLMWQEIEAGRLSLDDTLGLWYPEIPLSDDITISMLLNMSSGIADYANADIITLIQDMLADPRRRYQPDALIAKGASLPRAFTVPGSQYSYSNTNTVILGRILEKSTGETYRNLLQQRLFEPLGLNRTYLNLNGRLKAPHAQTYSEVFSIDPDGPPVGATTKWSISWAWSAGALASTIDDFRVWGRTLGTGRKAISPGTASQRLSDCMTAKETVAITMEYCLGLVANSDNETGDYITLWHNGQVFGAVSYIGYYPRTGAVVAVLANSDITDENDESVAGRVRAGIEKAIPGLLGMPRDAR